MHYAYTIIHISFLHSRNKGRQKCMMISHIFSGYYPAKAHVALLQFWRWCLLEVVFVNGWVPLLIIVTRPIGGHCRQRWDAVAVNSPSYLLSHHSCFRVGSLWCIYIYVYILKYYTDTCDILWFSSSWFPSCLFSCSSFSQMIVAVTPPVTDMKGICTHTIHVCYIYLHLP